MSRDECRWSAHASVIEPCLILFKHLLRTLTESQVKPTVDLRLLLTTVKEGRVSSGFFWRLSDDYIVIQRLKDDVKDAKDSKLSDPFYDSLEGLLSDLKAVTVVCGASSLCFPVSRLISKCRIIGMQKHFLNLYPRQKYRITTRVNLFLLLLIWHYSLKLYATVIANPMDFQTMLKKVKQKTYKSKREFKDDLELIWTNCYTYNASEVR